MLKIEIIVKIDPITHPIFITQFYDILNTFFLLELCFISLIVVINKNKSRFLTIVWVFLSINFAYYESN